MSPGYPDLFNPERSRTMISIEERLAKSGIVLPDIPAPAGLYQPAIRIGDFVFTSGQLPLVNGALLSPGGDGCVTEQREQDAANAARTAALNAIAAVRNVTGTLDCISRIVKLTVYVSSAEGFTNQHKVANGSSELIGSIFGEAGHHVRSAIGVQSLPLGASVEIELVAHCAV